MDKAESYPTAPDAIIVATGRDGTFSPVTALRSRVEVDRGRGCSMEPAFLKALIRTIPDMVWLKDPSGVFLACNPATARFFGTLESEVVGKTDYDFFPADEAEVYRARDREAAASEDPVTHREWVVFRGDGRRALMETIKTAMRNSSGGLMGVVGIARDITATDAAERILRDRLAVQAKLWGVQPEELAEDAARAWATVHPDDAAGIRAQLEESARTLAPWRAEFRVRHPRRGEGWLGGRSTPVREGGGSIHFHGFLTDISERKRMEAALESSAARLKEAQRLAVIGSWVWDVERDTAEWSEALYRLTGQDPASPPPRFEELHRFYTPESWERLHAAVDRALESGTPYELDLEVVLPDGRRGWETARGEAEREASGRIVRLRGTSQDITGRKRAEQEMLAAHAELAVIHAHAPVVFLVVDEDLRVEKVNDTAARFAGRPAPSGSTRSPASAWSRPSARSGSTSTPRH